jgi:hypothetical protein
MGWWGKIGFVFCFVLLLYIKRGIGQEVFVAPADGGIEALLDELAIDRIISLNSVAKPYSRDFMAYKLSEALKRDSLLSTRQKREVLFYLGDFSQDRGCLPAAGSKDGGLRMEKRLFCYDPIRFNVNGKGFFLSVRPVGGYTQYYNNNGAFYSATAGTGLIASLGKHFACAASISRTFENCILSEPNYFTSQPGGKWYKNADGSGSFIEWTGQFTWSWKWGSLGVYKDHFLWGDGYHGASYFSGKAPAFPFVKLHVKPAKWIEFTYLHAWLDNSVEDFTAVNEISQFPVASSISKHIAANLLTLTPWRGFDFSFGNSIVYDGSVQLAYLTPVFFYKSVDHTLSATSIDNENSQFFIDISSRQIKHLRLFLSLYVDEFKTSRIWTKGEHNFLSWKGGMCLSNFPFRNISLTVEGTRTLPSTYQHYIPTVTFASDGYNLGNYLRDNSQEIYVALGYKPISRLSLTLRYLFAEHGDEFQYGLVPYPTKLPVLQNISWQDEVIGLNATYSLLNGMAVFVDCQYSGMKGDVRFAPQVLWGTTQTMSAGLKVGF